ncbi:MAG: HD domain-containing protein [Candidatus Omnitrophica bacterium]|nr:HD domain-containing protein [Candidatus Omnitrophota bacterium]
MKESSRALIISDDEQISRNLREQLIIGGGFQVILENSSHGGLTALKSDSFDIVIMRYAMPDMSSAELIKGIKKVDSDAIIIAFLEDHNQQVIAEIFKLGVYDFISKPVNVEKLHFLVNKGIELHSLLAANRKLGEGLKENNASLQKQNFLLAKRIEESTRNLTRLYEDLRSTYMRTIKALAQAIEARDAFTHSHSENVAHIAVAIATQMGLSSVEVETVREACELHDLGKIGIEDAILLKPSSLTPQEWEQVKKHPMTGAQILEPLTFLNDVIELVRQHHEHFDGTGYPEGRKGEDILLGARILHVADAYEAMTSARSYRKVPFTKEAATVEIVKNRGTQFDPQVVDAFLKIVDRL